jgi:hypothetical protein
MAAPKRHRLLLYEHMINRWRSAIFAIGISSLILAGGLAVLPLMYPEKGFIWVQDWILWLLAGGGVYALFLSIIFFTVRRSANLQVYPDHLRLNTPFSRLKISYKRIKSVTPAEFQSLFPLKKMPDWKVEIVEPFARDTIIVVDMTSLPLSRGMLSLVLSPFFFPDTTPTSMAFLVPDWMALSMELESARISKRATPQAQYVPPALRTPKPSTAKPAKPAPKSGGLLGQIARDQKKRDE